jgi:hypothetical protein
MNAIDNLTALGRAKPLTAKQIKEQEAEEADKFFILDCLRDEIMGVAKRQRGR